ncbi:MULTISPECIES: N-6 DNA methylase [unclassified Enterococcus]|uniref:N-6 DNA methylase n=1 Tax=unclassified Enterococcus TaxID=2608891 RepID=UPI00247366A2|nr:MULTISPECIES: N-6 DNA methylase [unclassified Enterococcus]
MAEIVAKKYGVVYTPNRLAEFAAELLYREAEATNTEIKSVLDPACGECALLCAAKKYFNGTAKYFGIDVDKEAIAGSTENFEIKYNDSILPRKVKKQTAKYWRNKFKGISAIIANPPWSSEKIYSREELQNAGFSLTAGQYDSFVLFVELAYNLLDDGGYFSFIIPDSLFDAQNEKLRRFLTEKTQIKVIARLGEKIFEEVNRATTVVVCRKEDPTDHSVTHCFRLTTEERKKFLTSDLSLFNFYNEGVHDVLQRRFSENAACNFDVDTHADEETLLSKIKAHSINWEKTFIFGRGVEISKTGKVVFCPSCGYAQGYKKSQLAEGKKKCTNCGSEILVTDSSVQNVVSKEQTPQMVQIYVGENIRRYGITGEFYIKSNIPGINYKNRTMYTPPKLLVRKTGLGIYASIDYTGSMTSQTVYILKFKDSQHQAPLEYYLALLNSRVVYYFYLKAYGENEWKSHPYFTKQIIYSLPIREFENSELDRKIIEVASELAHRYEYSKDVQLEKLIMKKYGLSDAECNMIYGEMNRLPDLSAINNMKVEVEDV